MTPFVICLALISLIGTLGLTAIALTAPASSAPPALHDALRNEISGKDRLIAALQKEIAAKDREIAAKDRLIAALGSRKSAAPNGFSIPAEQFGGGNGR